MPYSNYTEDEYFNLVFVYEPFEMTIVRLLLFGVLFLVAVVGNIIVFSAPFRYPHLRCFSYYLITALAISDFISVLGMPLIVASGELGSWIFGEALCRGLNPTQIICSMVTSNVHTVISIDRHIAVTNPFRIKPTERQTVLVMAIILMFSLICALPAFGARKLISYNAVDGKVLHACIEHFPVRPKFYQQLYTVFLFVVNYFLPFTIMFCLYTRVVIKLKNSEMRRRRTTSRKSSSHTNPSTGKRLVASKHKDVKRQRSGNSSICSSNSGSLEKKPKRYTTLEKNFIKMIFLVLAIFFMCYLPYQIFFLLLDFATEMIENWKYKFIVYKVFFLITWIPNALNPICYNAMDRYYKRAFRGILKFCRQAKQQN